MLFITKCPNSFAEDSSLFAFLEAMIMEEMLTHFV